MAFKIFKSSFEIPIFFEVKTPPRCKPVKSGLSLRSGFSFSKFYPMSKLTFRFLQLSNSHKLLVFHLLSVRMYCLVSTAEV